MTRQDVNQALLQTSFLYGANGAYIEALQAKYEQDPLSVEPGWRDFFAALGDDPASVVKTARGASWRKPNWPETPKGDLINALDGDWPATEKEVADKLRAKAAEAGPKAAPTEDEIRRATRDSVRALIRSPFGVAGQLGLRHDAPRAALTTLAGSSPSASKNSRQPGSTESGSFSY